MPAAGLSGSYVHRAHDSCVSYIRKSAPRADFRERDTGEVRRRPLLGTPVNSTKALDQEWSLSRCPLRVLNPCFRGTGKVTRQRGREDDTHEKREIGGQAGDGLGVPGG